MVEIHPAVLGPVTGGDDEFGMIREIKLERRVRESPYPDIAETLVEFHKQLRIRVTETRLRGRYLLNGFRFLAQRLRHVFCEFIP